MREDDDDAHAAVGVRLQRREQAHLATELVVAQVATDAHLQKETSPYMEGGKGNKKI